MYESFQMLYNYNRKDFHWRRNSFSDAFAPVYVITFHWVTSYVDTFHLATNYKQNIRQHVTLIDFIQQQYIMYLYRCISLGKTLFGFLAASFLVVLVTLTSNNVESVLSPDFSGKPGALQQGVNAEFWMSNSGFSATSFFGLFLATSFFALFLVFSFCLVVFGHKQKCSDFSGKPGALQRSERRILLSRQDVFRIRQGGKLQVDI